MEDLLNLNNKKRQKRKCFLSSYENNIDKKGRVSVPASFRSHISSMGFNSFIAYPSFSNKSLECCTQDRIEKII